MGQRAGLYWCGKYRRTGIRSPNRPARRQSLYRLHYSAHNKIVTRHLIPFKTNQVFEWQSDKKCFSFYNFVIVGLFP